MPSIAQHSVKGTKVMIRPPFESVDQVTHNEESVASALLGTTGRLPRTTGTSLGQEGREKAPRTSDQAPMRATDCLTRPQADVWYGSSWHNCDAIAATRTRPAPASHCLEQAR